LPGRITRYHDARFTRFTALADDGSGAIEVFDGKRIEVSPQNLAAVSVYYVPIRGFLGGVSMNYTGNRFLDRDNTILAEGFATVDLSADTGHHAGKFGSTRATLAIDGTPSPKAS